MTNIIPSRSEAAKTLLLVHAGLVGGLIALFAVMSLTGGPGANIGAGLVGLVLQGLGLPWSLVADIENLGDLPAALWYLAAFGPAVLNVVLHAALTRRWRRAPALGAQGRRQGNGAQPGA